MAHSDPSKDARKWVLTPLAVLAAVAMGVFYSAEWFASLSDVAFVGAILRRFETHPFLPAGLTLAFICLLELAVCRLLRLGEPVIGLSLINGLVAGLLTIVFFTILGATALFARATGKTSIPRYVPNASTYWLPREQEPVSLETMRKQ